MSRRKIRNRIKRWKHNVKRKKRLKQTQDKDMKEEGVSDTKCSENVQQELGWKTNIELLMLGNLGKVETITQIYFTCLSIHLLVHLKYLSKPLLCSGHVLIWEVCIVSVLMKTLKGLSQEKRWCGPEEASFMKIHSTKEKSSYP